MLIIGIPFRNILVCLGIILAFLLSAAVFYFVIRKLLKHLALKTGTVRDNLLVQAIKWPITVALIMLGFYLGIISLPLQTNTDFEIRRSFYLAFIMLGASGIAMILDGLYRWFKLEIVPKTQTAIDDWLVVLLRISTPLVIVFAAIIFSIELFGINTTMIRQWLVAHGIRIGLVAVVAVVILFAIGIAGSKGIASIVARGAQNQTPEEIKKRADTLSRVLITTGQIFTIVAALFIILSELGIDIAPILAGAGVVGIAIGFGAQSLVKDIISGFLIVMENQYRIGDVVTIAGIGGLVEEMNLRRTVLRDLDGIVHVVPNGEIRVASNFTKEWSRVNLNISVSYDTNLDHATRVINRVCKEMAEEPDWAPLIIKVPQVLRVDNLGDSGIELKVLGDTKPIRQWDVMGEIRKRIKNAFDKEGIEIPWPHTKVYFGNAPFTKDIGIPGAGTENHAP
jgi:small-conductance mechanosensitive channel